MVVSGVRHNQTRALFNGAGAISSLPIQCTVFCFGAIIFDLHIVAAEREDEAFKHSNGSNGWDDHRLWGAEKYTVLQMVGSHNGLKVGVICEESLLESRRLFLGYRQIFFLGRYDIKFRM